MSDDKPELSELAEALGGAGAPQSEGETPGERKLREDRATFDKIAKDAAGDEPVEKPKAKKKDTPKAAEPEEEVKEDETPEPPQESEDSKKAKDYLRLKQTLPPSVIDSLSPDEAVEARRAVARRETEMDRVLEDLADLRKQRQEQEATKETEHDAVPAVEIDVEAMTARLKDTLGEDEGGAVASLLVDTVKGAVAPLQAALKEAQEELGGIKGLMDKAQEENTRTISTSNQSRLSEHIPQLEDAETWAAIEREVIHSLNENGKSFSSVEDAFDSVATRMYGAEALKNGKPKPEEDEDEASRIEASTVTVPREKKKPRKLTPDEQARKIFDHLEAHDGDIRGARKAARLT